ncbi:uncharacterized protein LOC111257113 [Setaria italica]|uniref:uncharacterized protein LOC111257113 n=1 Tax=Setaria italica TaxID=4555 RepID=UPI000BE4E47B|nr:uncharacterized protein LOC111257113 [Setaria italica]
MAAPASAAGSETPKQLLSIIRDFASEKSHGGGRELLRGVVELRVADRGAREAPMLGAAVDLGVADVAVLRAASGGVQEAAELGAMGRRWQSTVLQKWRRLVWR